MRERVTDSGTQDLSVFAGFYGNPSNDGTYLSWERSESNKAIYRLTRDNITIGYFGKKRRGEILPVNPFYAEFRRQTFTPGIWKWKTHPTSGSHPPILDHEISGYMAAHVSRGYTLANSVDWPSESTVQTDALAKLNTKAMDVGTFAAEFHRTVRMISGFRENLLKLISDLVRVASRKGGWTDAANFLSALADAWLEIRYGWRILYYDMQDIQRSVDRLNGLKSPLERTSSFKVAEDSADLDGIYLPGHVNGVGDYHYNLAHGTKRVTKSVKAMVGAETSVQGFGYIDPLTTAWELIPFSFIIDWFVNVGDFLSSVSPILKRDVVVASLTKVDSLECSYSLQWGGYKNTGSTWYVEMIENTPSTGSFLIQTKERESINPSASVEMRLNLNALKIADVWAIIWRYFHRR